MKIKEPERPEPPANWWVGAEVRCTRCGGEVELDESDVAGIDPQRPERWRGQCPRCGEWMFAYWQVPPRLQIAHRVFRVR